MKLIDIIAIPSIILFFGWFAYWTFTIFKYKGRHRRKNTKERINQIMEYLGIEIHNWTNEKNCRWFL